MSSLVATFWTENVGLLFTFLVLTPGVAIGLIIVAIVASRGEKKDDEELRRRWRRRREPGSP